MDKENSLVNKYQIDMTAEGIIKLYDTEKAERSSLESFWQTLGNYTLPRKDDIMHLRTPAQKLENEEIYDDTAIQANVTLANGLQTNLTPPNVKWFNLRARNQEINEDEEVREFFHIAGEQVFKVISQSNFSEQIHETYQDLGAFGTSCIFVEEDEQDDVRFHSLSVPKGIMIFEDSKRRVNKVIRCIEFTTTQSLEEFGDDAGETAKNAFKEKAYEKKHTFLHCVGERHARDVGRKDSKNKPYYSYWVSKADKKICKEGGYEEMPFYVTRFYKGDNSKYGYSPNMTCLPTIKSVNQFMADSLIASRLRVRPALDVPYKGYMGTIDLNPGKANYRRAGVSEGDRIKPIDTGADPTANQIMIERLQLSIKQAYYVNMFLALEDKTNMTATEVAERINEKMAQLGPALKRLENEMLQGVIHRVFMILIRKGKIPQPPQALVLSGLDYDVSYTSRLELAQKMSEIQSVDQMLARVGQLAAINPSAVQVVDIDQCVRFYEQSFNTPPLLTKRPERVEEERAQQQQQMMEQQMLQAGVAGSQIGKNVASGNKDMAQAEMAVK